MTRPATLDAVVIGAGSAGLAAAYWLQRRGLTFRVLEASARPDGAWPAYYDSLTLFTPARHSALPGLAFPGDPAHYPSRDEMAAYLRAYAAHFTFPLESHADVVHVERCGDGYRVTARDARHWQARAVICASGTFRRPLVPTLPGAGSTRVRMLHSASYRDPRPFAGQRVVVVGAGNSAAQIAAELGRVARVSLAVRHPLRVFPQRPFGRDLTGWLTLSGVERVPLGVLGRVQDVQPVIAVPGLRAALRRGDPDVQPMFTAFTPDGVRWAAGPGNGRGTGTVEAADTVIFATGYRFHAGYLPRMALDDHGEPRQRLGRSTALPRVGFVGLPGQRTVASSTVRAAGPDARAVVDHLARQLEVRRARP